MIDPSLLTQVAPLAARFEAAGRRLYLVGGIVRDQLLRRPIDHSTDIDLTTDARPAQIMELVRDLASAVWTQGERFGTIGCRIGAWSYEITTHRGEVYEPQSRKPAVTYADAIELDLARRDFTVNAMAAGLPGGELIDPYGGARDLQARVLRTPLAPEVSFSDDPLRMLRAARFLAGYALLPDRALLDAVQSMASRLAIVSAERRRDELDKLLAVADPRSGLAFLLDQGLMVHVVPELVELGTVDRLRVLDTVAALPAARRLRVAALFGPDPSAVEPRLRALRYSTDDIRAVARIVEAVKLIGDHVDTWTAADVRHLAWRTRAQLDDAVHVATVGGGVGDLPAVLAALRATEDLDDLEPGLDGDAVMAVLEMPAGPAVGQALAFLTDVRLREGVLDRAELTRRLVSWWRARES